MTMTKRTSKTAQQRRDETAVRKQKLIENLRDDSIGVFVNSKMTYEQAHEAGGPTPATIGKWVRRETRTPQLATIMMLLQACDHDLYIAPKGEIARRTIS
jgi:hypothetical protein